MQIILCFCTTLTSTRKELEKERNPPIERVRWSPDRRDKKRQYGNTLSTMSSETSRKTLRDTSLCLLCKGQHSLVTCKDFLRKSVKERQDLCMSRGICFSCLSQGHTARHCKKKTQCNECKKPHATVLHRYAPGRKHAGNCESHE